MQQTYLDSVCVGAPNFCKREGPNLCNTVLEGCVGRKGGIFVTFGARNQRISATALNFNSDHLVAKLSGNR